MAGGHFGPFHSSPALGRCAVAVAVTWRAGGPGRGAAAAPRRLPHPAMRRATGRWRGLCPRRLPHPAMRRATGRWRGRCPRRLPHPAMRRPPHSAMRRGSRVVAVPPPLPATAHGHVQGSLRFQWRWRHVRGRILKPLAPAATGGDCAATAGAAGRCWPAAWLLAASALSARASVHRHRPAITETPHQRATPVHAAQS